MQQIKGRCPMGCGETLFVGQGGYVTCSYIHCPDPAAASRLLRDADKIDEHWITEVADVDRA